MSARSRQNLSKRTVDVAERSSYDVMASSYGAEWERLLKRRGLPPPERKDPERLARALATNGVYGKFATGTTYGRFGSRIETNTEDEA